MQRIVVAIDSAAKASNEQDRTSETGLIVAGLGRDERGYGLDDLSYRLSPRMTGIRRTPLVVTINQGGAMVEAVLRAERAGLPLRQVRASRGKAASAP
jgi:phage terminase large subunit-like protein